MERVFYNLFGQLYIIKLLFSGNYKDFTSIDDDIYEIKHSGMGEDWKNLKKDRVSILKDYRSACNINAEHSLSR